MQRQRGRALADLGGRAVAAARPHQLVDGRVAPAAGSQPREVAAVDQRRVVVGGAALADPLGRDRALGQQPAVRGQRAGEGAALGARVEAEAAGHVHLAELLGEALDPAPHQREVAVDPDVGAAGHVLVAQHRVHDQEELLVLAADGVEQLLARVRARLPVDEQRGAAAGIVLERRQPGRQHRRHGGRVGPVLDHQEVAHVVPGRGGHQRGAALGAERQRVAARPAHAGRSSAPTTS